MKRPDILYRYRVVGIATLSYPITFKIPGGPTGTAKGLTPWTYDEMLTFNTPQTDSQVLASLQPPTSGFLIEDTTDVRVVSSTTFPPEAVDSVSNPTDK